MALGDQKPLVLLLKKQLKPGPPTAPESSYQRSNLGAALDFTQPVSPVLQEGDTATSEGGHRE